MMAKRTIRKDQRRGSLQQMQDLQNGAGVDITNDMYKA